MKKKVRFAKGDDRDYSGAGHRGQSFPTKLLDDTRHVLASPAIGLDLVVVRIEGGGIEGCWRILISIVKSTKFM